MTKQAVLALNAAQVKVDQWLFGCVLRLRISHMDEFTISSAFLNWRSNNTFFLSKALLGICIDLHRNQSFLKSYSAFSSPFLPAVGRWNVVFGQADRLSKKNSPVVCAEGRGSQASFLAQPQWYLLCRRDLGATTTLEVPCFWGRDSSAGAVLKNQPSISSLFR